MTRNYSFQRGSRRRTNWCLVLAVALATAAAGVARERWLNL